MILLLWLASLAVAVLCRPRRATRMGSEESRSLLGDLFAVAAPLFLILTSYLGLFVWAYARDEDGESLAALRQVADVVCKVARWARWLRVPAALSFAGVIVFLLASLHAAVKGRSAEAGAARRGYAWFRRARSWARRGATVGTLLVSFSFFGDDTDGAVELRIRRLEEESRGLVADVERALRRATAEAITAKAVRTSPPEYRKALDERRDRISACARLQWEVAEVWPVLKIPTPQATRWLADHEGFDWSDPGLTKTPSNGPSPDPAADWNPPDSISARDVREARSELEGMPRAKAPAESTALDAALGADVFESAVDTAIDLGQPHFIEELADAVPLVEPLYDVLSSVVSSRLGEAIRAQARVLLERWLRSYGAPGPKEIADAAGQLANGIDADWARAPPEILTQAAAHEATEAASVRSIAAATKQAVEAKLPDAIAEMKEDNVRLAEEIAREPIPVGDSLGPIELLPELQAPRTTGQGSWRPGRQTAPGQRIPVDDAWAVVARHRELEARLGDAKASENPFRPPGGAPFGPAEPPKGRSVRDALEKAPERLPPEPAPKVEWWDVLWDLVKREPTP